MTAPQPRPPRGLFRPANLLWLAAYAALLAAIVLGMLQLRRAALATLATPEARRQWQAWRDAPPNTRKDQPVARRPPSSDEPPGLILLRDYFGVMLVAAVVFGSLLFAALVLAARGALWRAPREGR